MENAGVNVKSLVKQVVLPIHFHQFYNFAALLLGAVINLTALLPGVGISVQAHMGQDARSFAADGGHQLAIDAEGHGVGRDLVLADCPANGGRHP